MKSILFLADINSSHTQKWVQALSAEGFRTGIFTLSRPASDWYESLKNFRLYSPANLDAGAFHKSSVRKLSFLRVLPALKKSIRDFHPDVVHSHYATSYGLLGKLSGFHPHYLSVWGSDLFEFPRKSFIHRSTVKSNLLAADRIFSTSRYLHAEVKKLCGRESEIIPFGIDANRFRPGKGLSLFEEGTVVIGTVKSLEKIYCIDTLVKAFAGLRKRNPQVRLLIVGEGTREKPLKDLVRECGLEASTLFAGRIPFEKIPFYQNTLDVFVNISAHESFGVAVLEASACGKPVVVSDAAGLQEVHVDGETGITVPVNNTKAVEDALDKLVRNASLRRKLGEAGRKFVLKNFDWNHSLKRMMEIYSGDKAESAVK